MNRRKFVKKLSLSLLGLFTFIYIDSYWFEKYIIDWTKFDLSNKGENTIKIVQLTDLHLREIKYFHKTIAAKIAKEEPDIIAFTGDSITSYKRLHLLEGFLKLLNPDIFKVVILGNKEYDGKVPLEDYRNLFKKYNGTVLVNENHVYTKNTRRINLIGIDDFLTGNANFNKAILNVDKSLDTVVLNHCPEYSDEIAIINEKENLPIKMILSGHTHGGQVTFFGLEIYKPSGSGRFLKGWYKLKNTKMYVSKGIGTTILPIRFCARAEASIFNI
ncbi:metallophosphoesterase [Cellulophaga baltica]|uniref:metallophosphoesterase n=1 Tax=Cellulophaga TaxID=104264 RepID=UPI001C078327|nr:MULTISPECIES: metallophosphoesterase [Cellulophaga]MBU2997425.1 metallophosphoesterase [Cellulophaga baltica]MDO6768822.1 metallophosphoesterase [Cellulophaga sp. 1_MG-2023]